ncbi:MAG: gamma-glutamyltransferase family protein [Gemmatimonadales bacterium]
MRRALSGPRRSLGGGVAALALAVAAAGSVGAQQAGTMAGRSPVYAPHGVVATPQPLASQAGLRVLQEGGNAVDAAVTALVMLSLVEPMMSGPGGDVFAILWSAKEQRLVGLNASGRAGSHMTLAELRRRGHQRMPVAGAETVTVPGAISGWAALLERYGTRSFAEALAPTVALARDGFPVSPVIASEWAVFAETLRADSGGRAALLLDGARAPAAGEWFSNRDYAATLERLAAKGPGDFYGGVLGRRVVDGVERLGGFLTVDDLVRHRVEWVDPIGVPFRGYRLWELPPNGQGIAALEMLRILEPFELERMGHNSAAYLHHLIEAKKLAYADLERWIGDPDQMRATPAQLLSDRFVERRRALLDPTRASAGPEAGELVAASNTTYLTAADAEGNMISLIASLASGFGSGVVVPGTGFALQNRGVGFSLEPDRPNTVAPGRRPLHTIIPGFVTRIGTDGKDEPWVSYGIVGGAQQPQAHVQVLLNMVAFGMDPQRALDAARFNHLAGLRVGLEAPIPTDVVAALEAMGHERLDTSRILGGLPVLFGGGQVIVRARRGWIAGSEPRRDGLAAGY